MAVPPSSASPPARPDSLLASDPTLQPFLSPAFSPIAYLNSTLPTWSPSTSSMPPPHSHTQAAQPQQAQTLAQLTSLTQTHVTTLDAKLARLSATLTQLTDEILRNGGRLSYEVEILRGDVNALVEALASEALAAPMSRFSINGVPNGGGGTVAELVTGKDAVSPGAGAAKALYDQQPGFSRKPQPLTALHTLTLARQRLQSVTQVFDSALSWPLPPSSLSLRNQFIGASAPSSSSDKVEDLEAKGKEWESSMREEVDMLMDGVEEDREIARRKVGMLRGLVQVWRGTVEERARARFVDELERLVYAGSGRPSEETTRVGF